MTPAESLALTRYVKAGCPQQAFDEFTPDAWHDLLGDLRFVDCKDAARTITQRQPFCSPSEIRAEVKRLRTARIGDAEHWFSPPPGVDYGKWLGEMRRRAGDGEFEGQAPAELPERDMRAIEGTFQRVHLDHWPTEAPDQTVERARDLADTERPEATA